ncbi:MAG: hypothetical protein EPN75_08820 [Beijerinckiaceae bacterium]|nr:MAG: hypothetical protein EPN75_08820 [Beijerinckiaceae bacterium]
MNMQIRPDTGDTAYKITNFISPSDSRSNKNSPWSEPVLIELRRLATQNLQASVIAERLTNFFGFSISRNSVIGKCYREGLSLSESRPSLPRAQRPKKPRIPKVAIPKQTRPHASKMISLKTISLTPVPTRIPVAEPDSQQAKRQETIKAVREFDAFHQAIVDSADTQQNDGQIELPQLSETASEYFGATEPVPFMEATGCRYITARSSATNETYCCGQTVYAGKQNRSFCKSHYALCYQPIR